MAHPTRPRPRPGDVLDNTYRLGSVIGQGGMATVFEARAPDRPSPLAIKILHLDDQDRKDLRRRFFNELLLATRVRHPRIVEICDFGLVGLGDGEKTPYLVMERLFGRTVRQQLRRDGPMDPARAALRILEALDGIEVAHQRGVVHADIKPSNLFLRDPGTDREQIAILDFGVARSLSGSRVTPCWGGTPPYAPPESLFGAPPEPPIDLYQLGIVLAEMLSAQRLIGSDDIGSCIDAHAAGIELPVEVELSAFAYVVERAIHPRAADRFQSAAEMRSALVIALDHHRDRPLPSWGLDPTDRREALPPQEICPPPGGNPAGASWLVAILVVLIVALAALMVVGVRLLELLLAA